MVLIIEIALTMAAWRKGWKGWALFPIISDFVVGFILGMASSDSVNGFGEYLWIAICWELVMLVVLIIMAVKNPNEIKKDRPPAEELGKKAEMA